MASELESRLNTVLTEDPATRVMRDRANWAGGFGGEMNEIRTLIPHVTAGWPAREKVEEFVQQYIGPPTDASKRKKAGIGTQFFISGDGTVMQTIDLPRMTWHGNHMNRWAIGVETGNLTTVARPQFPLLTGKADNRWRSMTDETGLDDSDIGGAKLWISGHNFNEVVMSWWTTDLYDTFGPAREPVGRERRMLFTEWQYRSWALLARYICEQFGLPRNFPLLPHALRSRTIDNASTFRRIALADERFAMIARSLSRFNIAAADFNAGNEETLQQRYTGAILAAHESRARQNQIWTELFNTFRGVHGHGFSGANERVWSTKDNAWVGHDHDCPGPLFDWHRFAREVWDWWWWPFDLTADLSGVELARRPESKANGSTPLVEYFFGGTDFDLRYREYVLRGIAPQGATPQGLWDGRSSPSVFRLRSWAPIYAPANGELVAIRYPLPDPAHPVSMAFMVVRHEVFHVPQLTSNIVGVDVPAPTGRIDYDREPTYVYSLIMHLGRPDGMSFEDVTEANPDWLNRLLKRKKECDLAVERENAPKAGDPPAANWQSRPPGSVTRPTHLEWLRTDKDMIDTFLETLAEGKIATPTWAWNPSASPIRIILGDFLGEAGCTRKVGGSAQFGIGFEVFASTTLPTFDSKKSLSGWVVPGNVVEPVSLEYQSEWAIVPDAQERQRLEGLGANPNLVPWWREVALYIHYDPRMPARARLDERGMVHHFRPTDFMRWINNVTWASEWPKYQVKDENGNLVQRPARPRARRV